MKFEEATHCNSYNKSYKLKIHRDLVVVILYDSIHNQLKIVKLEAETYCHLITLNKINIYNTSCVLTYKNFTPYLYYIGHNGDESSKGTNSVFDSCSAKLYCTLFVMNLKHYVQ